MFVAKKCRSPKTVRPVRWIINCSYMLGILLRQGLLQNCWYEILFFANRVSAITVNASCINFYSTVFYFLFHRQFVEVMIDGVFNQRISVERCVSFFFNIATNSTSILLNSSILIRVRLRKNPLVDVLCGRGFATSKTRSWSPRDRQRILQRTLAFSSFL